MPKKFSWSAPPLKPEDDRLLASYEKIGRPLDLLPYTEDFEKLMGELVPSATDEAKADVFRRLLYLRKAGRLPRAASVIDVAAEPMPLSTEDEELLSAYQQIGRPLDSLPYTTEFDDLVKELGKSKKPAIMHALFQRLLRLRKRGRLPRISQTF